MEQAEFTALAASYFHYTDPATFFRCPWDRDPANADIALIGVPFCGGNAIERGQHLAPRQVRNISMGYRRAHREFKLHPFELCRINDLGDAPVARALDPKLGLADINEFFRSVDAGGARPFSVGGDHSITLPALRAIAGPQSRRKQPVSVVHFDSHSDAFPPTDGVEHAGTGFYLGVEEGLIDPKRSLQIGFNGAPMDLDQDAYSYEAGYRVVDLDECEELGPAGIVSEIHRVVGDNPVFLSFDVDVIDLPWAPAVANPEVGGLTVREAQKILRGMRGLNLIGADLVCYVPHKDPPGNITAHTISALMHDALAVMAERVHREVAAPAAVPSGASHRT
jgi:guanidinopropionase